MKKQFFCRPSLKISLPNKKQIKSSMSVHNTSTIKTYYPQKLVILSLTSFNLSLLI